MTNRTHATYILIALGAFAAGFAAAQVVTLPGKNPPPDNQLQTLEQKLPQISLDENLSVQESSPTARLRVLNGRVVPVYERQNSNVKTGETTGSAEPQKEVQTVRLAGLRILGEMENIGAETVRGATPVLRFYDADDQLITTKVAQWNDEFIPLDPGQKQVYDVLIPDPPKSETISIEMRSSPIEEGQTLDKVRPLEGLKIKENQLEPAEYERKDPKTKEKVKIKYYKFSGSLVNTADFEVVSPTVYVWIKNDKNEVIGVTKKVYSTDILAPGQELPVNLLIVPVAEEEEVFSHEVTALGERL
jgi:hypothetical protein